jgi:hypothetical protein
LVVAGRTIVQNRRVARYEHLYFTSGGLKSQARAIHAPGSIPGRFLCGAELAASHRTFLVIEEAIAFPPRSSPAAPAPLPPKKRGRTGFFTGFTGFTGSMGSEPIKRYVPLCPNAGPHRAQDSGRVLQTRPKSAVGGRSPAHGVAVGDGSIPSTRSQRFAR